MRLRAHVLVKVVALLLVTTNMFYFVFVSNKFLRSLQDPPESTENKVFSISSNEATRYLFYMVIQAYVARDFHNMGCVLLTVGPQETWETNERLIFFQRWLRRAAIDTGSLYTHLNFRSGKTSKWAQLSRYTVTAFDQLKPETVLIMTDADMIVISRRMIEFHGKQILSTNSYCCGEIEYDGHKSMRYVMSNIGMSVATWRAVLGYPRVGNESVVIAHAETIHRSFERADSGEDEIYLSHKINTYLATHRDATIHRELKKEHQGRIDRVNWPSPEIFTRQFVRTSRDAHLPRNDDPKQVWPLVRPLFVHLLRDESIAIIDQYYNEFAANFQD
jgi:hypothetical protein